MIIDIFTQDNIHQLQQNCDWDPVWYKEKPIGRDKSGLNPNKKCCKLQIDDNDSNNDDITELLSHVI